MDFQPQHKRKPLRPESLGRSAGLRNNKSRRLIMAVPLHRHYGSASIRVFAQSKPRARVRQGNDGKKSIQSSQYSRTVVPI